MGGCRSGVDDQRQSRNQTTRIVASMRSEPQTFNGLVSSTRPVGLVSTLVHDTLVRVNRKTGQLEPRLARDWTAGADGQTYTLRLRDDARFADGVRVTSADVVFTLKALYDQKLASPLASGFEVNDKPLRAASGDEHTVTVTFPSPYGPGLSILSSLPILPRHKLEAALNSGNLASAWSLTTPLPEIVGAGPFMLSDYVPGQHMRFSRNPQFWNKPLPHLDEIEIQFVPELGSEMLRLQSGQTDLTNDFVRAEDLAALRQVEKTGAIALVDAGVDISPSGLWFDLAPGAPHAKDKPWLQREEFRKGISYAVDRDAIVNTVYLGAAVQLFGPITPGHGEWYVPDLPATTHDVKKARELLAAAGLADRDGDGRLEDSQGRPARFTILTQKGNTPRERTVSVLQSQLQAVGLAIDVSAVDTAQLISLWGRGDYDALYYGIASDSKDPATNLQYWMSSGSFHLWNPAQPKPATAWEARIDELMRKQSTTTDDNERRRLFKEVQLLLVDHMPCLYFAAPKATIAMSARLTGAMPSVLIPPVLWNAEVLSVTAHASR
jgi:peptide/nickel transport system substrate-binding protein